MTSNVNEYLENILAEAGGCGRFQILTCFFVMGIKAVVSWSVLMMSFGGAVPEWTCIWKTDLNEEYKPNSSFIKQCSLENLTADTDLICVSKTFDSSMSTIVNEWNLVCDKEWIISTITTIQMGGLLLGAMISGQFGDIFGRKITYILSLLMIMVTNIISAFSVNWQMFATLRFFIGFGSGWYLTIYGIFLAEFTPLKFRPLALIFPSWALGTVTFGLFAWILHDWKYIQIATAVFCVPWIVGFYFVPESYRWLISHNRVNEGHKVINKMFQVNKKPSPDEDVFFEVMEKIEISEKTKTYSVFDLFKNKKLRKTTLLTMVCWFTVGYGFYAISFGVEQLSGDLYLNIVLLGLVDIPAISASYLSNCIGRKLTTILLFILAGLTGITVGVFQLIDMSSKGTFINGFALSSKLFMTAGWSGLWVLTSELYPTVVRNVGFGMNNALARFGAMIAPQLVFASKHVPGLSYIILGGLFFLSALCVIFLQETNNKALQDTIEMSVKEKEKFLQLEK